MTMDVLRKFLAVSSVVEGLLRCKDGAKNSRANHDTLVGKIDAGLYEYVIICCSKEALNARNRPDAIPWLTLGTRVRVLKDACLRTLVCLKSHWHWCPVARPLVLVFQTVELERKSHDR